MSPLNQFLIEWDPDTTITITVSARIRGQIPSGVEQRLAELIAVHLWAAYQLAELQTPHAQ